MQDRERQRLLSSNKATYLLWSIIIFVLILDTSLANLGNLISTNFSTWKIYLYSSVSIISIVGQFYILRFLKQKNPAIRTKMKINFEILFKVVSGVQYTVAGILVITLVQMFLTSYYSIVLLIASMVISYILAIFMMLQLAQRFFSWFRSRRNLVIVLYGLGSVTIGIELGLILIVTMALFESINRTGGGANLLSMTPVFPPAISYLADKINSAYIIFSIVSFVMTWIATALLLRQYSKLGKVRYWSVVSLPLLFFLFQFIAFILNTYVPFLTKNSIFDSIVITLIFTLSKPAGGILFGIAFWTMAKDIPAKKTIRQYLIISGFGLLILFIADQAITLIAIPYPPFGLATISFLGLSSYMILLGIYSSAISVAEDSTLRKSIRDFTLGQSRLLDSIGSAEVQQELERRVMELTKQNQDMLVEETGIQSSLTEEDMKQYLEQVIREVEKRRASNKESKTNNDNA